MCSVRNSWTNSAERRDSTSTNSSSNSAIRTAMGNDVVTMASTEKHHCENRIAHTHTDTDTNTDRKAAAIYGGRCRWFRCAHRTYTHKAMKVHCVCYYRRNCFHFFLCRSLALSSSDAKLCAFSIFTLSTPTIVCPFSSLCRCSRCCCVFFFSFHFILLFFSAFNFAVLSSFVGSFVALFPTDIFLSCVFICCCCFFLTHPIVECALFFGLHFC